jgi:hypothetical protein
VSSLGRPLGVLPSAAVRVGQDMRFHLLTPYIDLLALVLQGDRLRSDHLTPRHGPWDWLNIAAGSRNTTQTASWLSGWLPLGNGWP